MHVTLTSFKLNCQVSTACSSTPSLHMHNCMSLLCPLTQVMLKSIYIYIHIIINIFTKMSQADINCNS